MSSHTKLADDPTQYPDDRERIEEAMEYLTDEELADCLVKLEQSSSSEYYPEKRGTRWDLEGFMFCGWPKNRQKLLQALEPNGIIGQYLKDKDTS